MVEYKNRMAMKRIFRISMIILMTSIWCSCKEIDIEKFHKEDSAVCFKASSSLFSLKGVTEDWISVEIPVTLIGPTDEVNREFGVIVSENSSNTAKEGVDFRITKHEVEAGALEGKIVLEIKNFTGDVTRLNTTLEIVENENFHKGYASYLKANVEWSEEYVRPELGVWRYWYLYFSHCYSRALHEIIVDLLGEEVEKYTGSASYVKENPELTMKMPTWWYEASRTVYQYVRSHDMEHPEEPLMHSDDYQLYSGYTVAFGEGRKLDYVPTILETLETL